MILVGWKQIAEYYGGVSIKTAKRKVRAYSAPVVYRDGTPEISTKAFDRWVQEGPADYSPDSNAANVKVN